MKKLTRIALPVALAVFFLAFVITIQVARSRPAGDITNFDGIHLQGNFATATPALMVDQQGTGVIAEFRDNATPVARFPNGGGLTISSGNLVVSDNVTISGTLTITGGIALTDVSLTDNLTVTQDMTVTGGINVGNDAYVDGTLNVTDTIINDDLTVTDDITGAGSININGDAIVNGTLTATDTNVTDDLNVTGDVVVTGTTMITGNTTITGTLALEGIVFSGPVVFGSTSDVISGTLVAHGLGTTPTAVVLTPLFNGTVVTQVVYLLATNATSFTVGIGTDQAEVVTMTTVYWMAGK